MELHQLRYIVAVARAGNFSRAAEECHVSQPSLSQQVMKLEEELGERLFERLRRHARLTPAGERFLPRAMRILAEVDAATREAEAAHELENGRVVVGVLPTIAPYFLPRVVGAFQRRFPGVEVVVQEDMTRRLLQQAVACEIDFAIASLPVPDGRFVVEELFKEELLLAMPAAHALAKKRRITIQDLEPERFILMQEGHCLGEQILGFCNRRDLHPRVSCRSAQVETVQAMVMSGLGVSLVPAMAQLTGRGRRPVYRSLASPVPERSIAVLWPRSRPPGRAAEEFLRCVREAGGSGFKK